MNWTGVVLGLFSALAIGLGFVWVIRFEYFVGAYHWRWILALGLLICAVSLLMPNFLLAGLVGITGGSIAWGAFELPHQQERVDRDIFRAHPKRAERPRAGDGHDHNHGTENELGKWWGF